MHKLPVFETAGRACQFLLRDAGTILRLSWFPLLILAIVQYFAARAQFAAIRSAFESGNVTALSTFSPMWQWQIASFVATILGTAIVAVALHRVILLGDRKPGRFLHIALGKVELLFALLPIILMVVPIIIVWALAFGLGAALLPKGTGGIAVILVLLFWAAWLFVFLRLELVLPITVLEGRYDFSQSWSLTRGNFWRILGLWLLVLIPFAIVIIVISAMTSPFVGFGAGAPKNISALFEQMESFLLIQSVLSFGTAIVGGALGVGVLSYTYKALSGLHPDAVWTPES